jgi:hypothetical protein
MEPYWTEDRIIQVRARALRLNSARDLPADQRFVQTFIYMAYPAPVGKNVYEHLPADFVTASTDEEVYKHAKQGYEAIKTWIEPIKESSIECPILAELRGDDRVCRMCAPSDQPLFTRDLLADIQSADTCMPYSKGEVDVNSIMIDLAGRQVEVFYEIVPAGVNGYVMDLGLGAHRPLKANEKLYELLVTELEKEKKI